MKTLFKDSFVLSLSEVLLKLSKLFIFVVIANLYSPETLGLYNYLVNFLLIFYVIGEFGLNTYITKEQSRSEQFPSESLLIVGSFKVFLTLVSFLFAYFIYIFIGQEEFYLFFLVSLLLMSDTILSLIYSFYRAKELFIYELLYKSLQAGSYLFVGILGLLVKQVGFQLFITILVFFNICLFIYAFYRFNGLKFNLHKKVSNTYLIIQVHFHNILPIFLATIFTTLYFRIDILMIENFMSLEQVGVYSVAFKLLEGAMILPLMLGVVLFTKLSKGRQNIKTDLIRHFIIGFVVFSCFYLFIDEVISILFNKSYLNSINIAKILSFSILIMSINTYLFNYFIANNKPYINVKISFLMLLSNLMLNYIFIPLYGLAAAAITTILTELFGMLFLFFYINLSLQKVNRNYE